MTPAPVDIPGQVPLKWLVHAPSLLSPQPDACQFTLALGLLGPSTGPGGLIACGLSAPQPV